MDAQWVLGLMLSLARAEVPSRHAPTYAETAAAIAQVSEELPLPLGDDSARKTAALVAVWAWHESRYDQRARGDSGTSYCLMQVNSSNFRALGIGSGDDLDDPRTCLRASLRLMRASFRACAARPLAERAAQYASGGPACDVGAALGISRRRLGAAKRLYEKTAQ